MTWKMKDIQKLEQLQAGGVPLDQRAVEEARAAGRGLVITPSGNACEDTIYAQQSKGMGLTISIAIHNNSERTIRVVEISLQLPWLANDFTWLKKRSSRELNKFGGYSLPASDLFGLDPSVVLNHRLPNLKLTPGEACEGLLLGESTFPVPETYSDRAKVPAQLTFLTGNGRKFGCWMALFVQRPKRPAIRKSQRQTLFA